MTLRYIDASNFTTPGHDQVPMPSNCKELDTAKVREGILPSDTTPSYPNMLASARAAGPVVVSGASNKVTETGRTARKSTLKYLFTAAKMTAGEWAARGWPVKLTGEDIDSYIAARVKSGKVDAAGAMMEVQNAGIEVGRSRGRSERKNTKSDPLASFLALITKAKSNPNSLTSEERKALEVLAGLIK